MKILVKRLMNSDSSKLVYLMTDDGVLDKCEIATNDHNCEKVVDGFRETCESITEIIYKND